MLSSTRRRVVSAVVSASTGAGRRKSAVVTDKICFVSSNSRCVHTTEQRQRQQQQQQGKQVATNNNHKQNRYFSTFRRTSACSKIYKINTDMSDEEAQRIIEEEERKLNAKHKEKFLRPDIEETWKPGERKRKLVVGYDLKEFEYEHFPERFLDPETGKPLERWTLRDKRCGALAIKVGMMPVWDDWGERHPCTILYMDKNRVLGHKTLDKHGYISVQVAAGERKAKNVGVCLMGQYKPILQHQEEEDQHPPYIVREFRITDERFLLPVGSSIHARHFVPGQNVDVAGITKGKGFQGGMKKHGFGGMPASHGVQKSHRAIGSTGSCQDPGKVFKGKKMPGRMGSKRRTVQNLRIIKIDRGLNLIYVRGAVPGQNGNFVEIRDAIKKPLWADTNKNKELKNMVLGDPRRPPLPTFDYDEQIDGCGESGHEEFKPLSEEDPLDPDYRDSEITFNFDDE